MRIFLLITGFLSLLVLRLGAETVKFSPLVRIEKTLPNEFMALQMENPLVRLTLSVDYEGMVVDVLCTWSTHYGLLQYALRHVEAFDYQWGDEEYYPDPYTFEMEIRFVDYEQKLWRESGGVMMPVGSNAMEGSKARLYRNNKEGYVYRQSTQSALDKAPELLQGQLVVLEDEDGNKPVGEVVVDYFIDHEGQARFPQIIRSSGSLATQSALLTIRNLRYSPVTSRGRPTYVKIRQPFNYE